MKEKQNSGFLESLAVTAVLFVFVGLLCLVGAVVITILTGGFGFLPAIVVAFFVFWGFMRHIEAENKRIKKEDDEFREILRKRKKEDGEIREMLRNIAEKEKKGDTE